MEPKDVVTLILGRWEFFLKLWDFYKVVSLALLAFVASSSFVRCSNVAILVTSVVFIGFAGSHLFGLIHARNQWDILAKAAAKSRSFSDDDMLKHIDIHKTDFLKAPPWGHVIIFHLVLDLAVLVALAVIHRASC